MAAKAMVCTTISASGAGLGVTSASLVLYQHAGPSEIINGVSKENAGGESKVRRRTNRVGEFVFTIQAYLYSTDGK